VRAICDDLAAEHADLDRLVDNLPDSGWLTETPSPGWSVADQISHLWFYDRLATMALVDPDAFAADVVALSASGGTEASVGAGRVMAPAELLGGWRDDRVRLLDVAADVDPATRVPWYGPAMGARSFITARLMETWAHGQDVADALRTSRPPTERLRHVAHIGVRARAFSYALHRLPQPDADVAVRLSSPSGDEWSWGESDNDIVSGPALDFCLVVTQRRHLTDTALDITGDRAAQWMSIAQAFAGDPGGGRLPGQFTDL
jgi:uncharacterized protein (TIGR03084 family)